MFTFSHLHAERQTLNSNLYPLPSPFRPVPSSLLHFFTSPPFHVSTFPRLHLSTSPRLHTTEANVVAGQAKPGRGGAAEAPGHGQPQARGAAGRGAQRGEEYDGGRVRWRDGGHG